MFDYLVQPGTFWNNDGAVGPWAPPVCRLTDDTAASANTPEWLKVLMPLSRKEIEACRQWMPQATLEPKPAVRPARQLEQPRRKLIPIPKKEIIEEAPVMDVSRKGPALADSALPARAILEHHAEALNNIEALKCIPDPVVRRQMFEQIIDVRWTDCRKQLMRALGIDEAQMIA